MLERSFEKIERARAEVIEVRLGHQRAGQWIVALVAEYAFLDETQGACFQPMPVKRADEREQVDMRGEGKVAGHACHDPAGPQDGQVEGSAVERRETVSALELLAQRVQERRFHAGLGEKELRDAKAAVDGCRDGGGEDVGARSTSKPGCLSVDVSD